MTHNLVVMSEHIRCSYVSKRSEVGVKVYHQQRTPLYYYQHLCSEQARLYLARAQELL